MSYEFSKTLELSFQDAVARTREALTAEGFGVINPALAYEAPKLEPNVGAMLPCNVVVQDVGGGRAKVSAIDPVASMLAINNPELKVKAGAVSAKTAGRHVAAVTLDRMHNRPSQMLIGAQHRPQPSEMIDMSPRGEPCVPSSKAGASPTRALSCGSSARVGP